MEPASNRRIWPTKPKYKQQHCMSLSELNTEKFLCEPCECQRRCCCSASQRRTSTTTSHHCLQSPIFHNEILWEIAFHKNSANIYFTFVVLFAHELVSHKPTEPSDWNNNNNHNNKAKSKRSDFDSNEYCKPAIEHHPTAIWQATHHAHLSATQ